jgi:putative phosphoribosyl transferase
MEDGLKVLMVWRGPARAKRNLEVGTVFRQKVRAQRFRDRSEAGQRLAARLAHLRGEDLVVVGLPRGGVPVAYEVARILNAPLDVILVRKLGFPSQPELGMGAIGEGGFRVINTDLVRQVGVSDEAIAAVELRERTELDRRAQVLRGTRPPTDLAGRTVVIVDDGIATGSTARVACQVARAAGAARVVLATPVAPLDWTKRLGDCADELVCERTPEPFYAIGQWYSDFSQTTDDEVIECLRRSASRASAGDPALAGSAPQTRSGFAVDRDVEIPVGEIRLGGHVTVPADAEGIVVFVHGSGSSRHSPRNQYVARVLNDAGLGTLLFDLLTEKEDGDRHFVFDVELLADRLVHVTHWLRGQPYAQRATIGYFGASTGAAAALAASISSGNDIGAVVSRGGRPDLAGEGLGAVTAPTLLIVGGLDEMVLELNRAAAKQLHCTHRIAVVPGATHLFAEPGTLQKAAALAGEWFVTHLAGR